MNFFSVFLQVEPDVPCCNFFLPYLRFAVRIYRIRQFLQNLSCLLRILSVLSQVNVFHRNTDPLRKGALGRLHGQKDAILRKDIPECDCRISSFLALFFRLFRFFRSLSPGLLPVCGRLCCPGFGFLVPGQRTLGRRRLSLRCFRCRCFR